MTRKQALAMLGLNESASVEDIKRAYRKMAFDLHPDLHPDNPDAAREFQQLNKAYMLLRNPEMVRPGARSASRGRSAPVSDEATGKAWSEAERAYAKAKKHFQEEAANPGGAGQQTPKGDEKSKGMKRDNVLRDLLRDPFARRVFEDIFNQIRDEATRKRTTEAKAKTVRRPPPPPAPGFFEKTAENVTGWLRRQIDEERTVRCAGPLAPGKRIRLQIQLGALGKSQTIELTLPVEFEPGRPIRLKGLGKNLGKWRGDLYLRILEQ